MNSKIKTKQVSISNIPEISAIYFALLQCGYEYYTAERDSNHIDSIKTFYDPKNDSSFFAEVKQDTCEVYPYWPRAAILETATFFICSDYKRFNNFDILRENIMSARNISDDERDQTFWEWLKGFPNALNEILRNNAFKDYFDWENRWIIQQTDFYKKDIDNIQSILSIYLAQCNSEIQEIEIVLNPIKCVYSADYHIKGNHFIFCSGTFSKRALIHEILHDIARPIVRACKEEIIHSKQQYPNIDRSYYLTTDDGRLNAFEEYFVRLLTELVLAKNYPSDLRTFLKKIMDNSQ